MILGYPFSWVNRRGSAAIGSTGVKVNADNVVFIFETNGTTQAVTKLNGAALTVADVAGTGVYQLWFERDTNTLQIMTGIV